MAAFDEHCYSNVHCGSNDDNKIIISTMCYRNNKGMQFPPSYQAWNGTNCDKNSKNVFLRRLKPFYQNFCYISVLVAFTLGLLIGVFIPIVYLTSSFNSINNDTKTLINNNNNYNSQELRSIFINNSYSKTTLGPIVNFTIENQSNFGNDTFPTVRFVESQPEPQIDNIEEKLIMASDSNFDTTELMNFIETEEINRDIINDGIYWGPQVESSLPKGYSKVNNDNWNKFVKSSIAVRLENGCGRMQNRLVTFKDGSQACVRYRQNTDQIQGELFSFYLAQVLRLPNVAPSTISIVDLNDPLWQSIGTEISSAQWNSNRPVVLTKYIKNLDSAHIPNVFKPLDRHLNKFDVRNMTAGDSVAKNFTLDADSKIMNEMVELAQWSDLIIFDYLTANLDRIVNNLYNYQWNVNIMDAPAHNLARKIDSNLLVFLDNESGLLHGYRLLKKYEIYHTLLLDNLCMFRKSTVDVIKQLKNTENVGQLLKEMFEQKNSAKVKDVLPTLPDKSIKILNERINRVYNQITKCESTYSDSRKT